MNLVENTFKEITNFSSQFLPENKSHRTALIVELVVLAVLALTAITAAGGFLLGCAFSPLAISLPAIFIYAANQEKSKEKEPQKNLNEPPEEYTAPDRAKDTQSGPLYFTNSRTPPEELGINFKAEDPLLALRQQVLTGSLKLQQ